MNEVGIRNCRGHKKILGTMEMFSILIMMVASQVYICVKTHLICTLNMCRSLYLNYASIKLHQTLPSSSFLKKKKNRITTKLLITYYIHNNNLYALNSDFYFLKKPHCRWNKITYFIFLTVS